MYAFKRKRERERERERDCDREVGRKKLLFLCFPCFPCFPLPLLSLPSFAFLAFPWFQDELLQALQADLSWFGVKTNEEKERERKKFHCRIRSTRTRETFIHSLILCRIQVPTDTMSFLHDMIGKTMQSSSCQALDLSVSSSSVPEPKRVRRSSLCLWHNRPTTHVSCLYPELLTIIFEHLDVSDKGRAAQVCKTWQKAAYCKSVWRGIEAKLHLKKSNQDMKKSVYPSLIRRGIKKVQVSSRLHTWCVVFNGHLMMCSI